MDKINQNNIVTEVQESFLDYSMSVIVARALPDLRDGLKPSLIFIYLLNKSYL